MNEINKSTTDKRLDELRHNADFKKRINSIINNYTDMHHDWTDFGVAVELTWRDIQIEQLQARIKELESQSHINEIKAQGINEAILHAKEFLFMPEEDINDYLALNCTLSNIKNYANKLRARTNGK